MYNFVPRSILTIPGRVTGLLSFFNYKGNKCNSIEDKFDCVQEVMRLNTQMLD